jgi:hypothetical protein
MRAPLLVPLVLAVCLPTSAVAKPSVSVSPEVVPPGGKLTVKGKGWASDARVSILVGRPNSEASKVGTLHTNSRGRFKGSLKFNESADQGRYVLLACRRQCAVKAKAKFRIAETVGRPAGVAARKKCGYVDITGGRAWKIRAINVRCKRARKLARTCLKGTRPRGWTVSYRPRTDRTRLTSGGKRVSFTLVGGGGCIEV